ncbi:hypothetical protein [Pseudophaeobacter sp.]|uniref:hypothetical protein n=1 Tax=Pseudophaeobacter sp. TaxID=1971739 RepID=UPI0032971054
MFGFVLLGLLVAGGSIALIADGFDDDNNANEEEVDGSVSDLPGPEEPEDPETEDPDPEEPEPVEEGMNLLFDGEDDLVGGAGNVTVSAGQNPDLAPEQIVLMGGDDVAIVDTQIGAGVFGGAGDDHLTSLDYGTPLAGGEGDDTLIGIGANNMSGGDGDDRIVFDNTGEPIDSASWISGGDGDDTISALVNVGIDSPDYGGAVISGGEGSDSFELQMHLHNSTTDLDGGGLQTGTVRLTDFDPAEDNLLISLEASEGAESRAFQTNLEQVQQDGRFVSTFTFTFHENANVSDATEARAFLTVESNAPFGLEDVTLLRV